MVGALCDRISVRNRAPQMSKQATSVAPKRLPQSGHLREETGFVRVLTVSAIAFREDGSLAKRLD